MTKEISESAALKVAKWIAERGIDGVPPLSAAQNLATEYKIDTSYENDDERIDSLINWETSKNFTSGFLTGLGGAVTMPVTIPSALGASWLIQARMAGAIAHICGHSLNEDRVRTLVLLSLLGDAGKEILKQGGIKIGKKLSEQAIKGVSGKTLQEINKRIGFRLLTKAGETGMVNLTKLVPVVGGLVGGTFDAISCRAVGRISREIFAPAR